MDELRAKRAESQRVEVGLSYLRRLAQGRLDIVAAEVRRRVEGAAPRDSDTLVAGLWAELGAFIRDQRQVGRISLRKLSEMAGISNPYLSQIERGLRKPSADILQQIAKALRVSAEVLYVRAGILEPSETSEVRD